jgi:hypothetical protein
MDTFARTLHSVVAGARQAEEFAGVLVSAAVEDALLCVARDYGHEYGALLRRYKDEIVKRHVSGSVGEKTACRGTTKGGKPCGKAAALGGYCQQHAVAMARHDTQRREVGAYAKATPASAKFDNELALLCGKAPADKSAYSLGGGLVTL